MRARDIKKEKVQTLLEGTKDLEMCELFSEDYEKNNLIIPCELTGDDSIEIGLNADDSIFITIFGANSEYTVVPSRENLVKLSNQISKLLYLTESDKL